ncbi:MAG: TetR/AcrR family transcriptional regulator [Alphaproteobacteria bacterium HGW-Alphaproteobacteria-16]|nr:MAG: TetR/AcrR family transcriptional regulator [Alphaproteobacteria bacterium HGW-Alphaproteobacteria-16]
MANADHDDGQPGSGRTITRDQLYELVWAEPLANVAARFGLSANGIAKICDRLGIPRPERSYWMRAGDTRPARLPLSPAPAGVDEVVVLGAGRAMARRPRSRRSRADRRSELLDAAAAMALEAGVAEVTLKRLAREIGISEAQAHNCFPGRTDLLLALTRRELAEVERRRQSVIARGEDRLASIVISTVTYLHQAKARGALLQLLLRTPEIREGLRAERAEAAAVAREPILRSLSDRFAMERSVANASTAALTAVCLRAGGLIAAGRDPFADVERICLALVMAGARSNESLGNESRAARDA